MMMVIVGGDSDAIKINTGHQRSRYRCKHRQNQIHEHDTKP